MEILKEESKKDAFKNIRKLLADSQGNGFR